MSAGTGAHVAVDAHLVVGEDVCDRRPEDVAVRDDHEAVLSRVDLGEEELQVAHEAFLARDLYVIAHVKPPEDEQQDAGGEVRQRTL